ncbi:MAG: hypothetical protein GX542_11075, partial [Rhodococcus sp.]|nr:hypothetical protein [Rhodococcus sp. (in: high G+C Gram-positive bacteria)]
MSETFMDDRGVSDRETLDVQAAGPAQQAASTDSAAKANKRGTDGSGDTTSSNEPARVDVSSVAIPTPPPAAHSAGTAEGGLP